MRPIKLEIQAIGPFADKQEIDFTKLTNGNIFMISGKTGSGKSTIFDAIMYALFDSPSIEGRNKESLRSDFANDEIESYVDFTYMSKQKTYRVKRMPKQKRIKKRGTGLKEADPRVELYCNGECITTKVKEANAEIAQMLGISAKQFRQIIMLAQGEFKKLLIADSKEREEIFRKIFQTEKYSTLQDKLGEKTVELKSQIKTVEIKLATILKLEAINVEDISIEVAKTILQEKRDLIDEELKLLNQQISTTQQKIEMLQIKQQKLNKLNELKAEVVADQSKYEKLLEDKTLINNGKIDLKKATKYQKIRDEFYQVQTLIKSQKNLLEKIKKNEKLTVTIKELEIQTLNKIQVEKLEVDLNNVQAKKINYTSEQTSLFKEKSKKDKINKLKKEKHQKKEEIDNLIYAKKTDEMTLKKYKEYINDVNNLQIAIENQKLMLDELNQQAGLIKSNRILTNKFEEQKKIYHSQVENYQKASEDLRVSEQHFYLNQAALLAIDLKENDSCPVCGSKNHPKLAKDDPKLAITKEQLDAKRKNTEHLRKLTEKSNLKSNELLKEIELKNELIKKDGEFIQSEITQHESNIKSATENLKHAMLFIEKNHNIEEKINQIDIQITNCEKAVMQITGEIMGLTVNRLKIEDIDSELEAITKLLKDTNYIEKEIMQKLKDNQKQNNNLVELKTTYRANNDQLNQDLYEVKKGLEHNKNKINDYLEKNELSYDQIENFLQIDTLKLQQLITNFEFIREQLKKNINHNKQAIIKIEKDTDFTNLAKLADLKAKLNFDVEKQGATNNELNRIEKNIKEVKRLYEKNNEQLKQYSLFANLERAARGQNEHYLTFERYILAIYFDEIIKYANLRLKRLTDNRYTFKRDSTNVKGQRQRGLDLVIYDFYTAKERDITTLSGGESFKAAIALALGLSDAMRIENGGIELETLFIDEGFGTLDEESLEMAIEVLNDLQSDGRLIGVISHVNLLKERIGQQIQVEKMTTGSKVKLQINQ